MTGMGVIKKGVILQLHFDLGFSVTFKNQMGVWGLTTI